MKNKFICLILLIFLSACQNTSNSKVQKSQKYKDLNMLIKPSKILNIQFGSQIDDIFARDIELNQNCKKLAEELEANPRAKELIQKVISGSSLTEVEKQEFMAILFEKMLKK